MGNGSPAPDEFRARENAAREERRTKENAAREERRSKENAVREERRAKENAARQSTKGIPYKGPRKMAREEAKKLGIDTAGMSTKEINQAISSAKSVEDDMMKFIEKTLERLSANKGVDVAPTDVPPTATRKVSEDKAQPIPPVGVWKSGGGGSETPLVGVDFWCYKDGEIGSIKLSAMSEFIPS